MAWWAFIAACPACFAAGVLAEYLRAAKRNFDLARAGQLTTGQPMPSPVTRAGTHLTDASLAASGLCGQIYSDAYACRREAGHPPHCFLVLRPTEPARK
jgi:hypothetical protein